MPDPAVLSLRDTLTRKMLRNGKQLVPLKTESIFILTNEEPKKKSTLGDSYKALLERFPIQMRVAWTSYTEQDYVDLLDTVGHRKQSFKPGCLAESLKTAQQKADSTDISDARFVLSHVLQVAGKIGESISPRTAVMAEQIIKAAVAMRGGTRVETQDLLMLRFLPSLALIDLEKEIKIAIDREQVIRREAAQKEGERHRDRLAAERQELLKKLASAKELGEIVEITTRLQLCDAEIEKLGLTESIQASNS